MKKTIIFLTAILTLLAAAIIFSAVEMIKANSPQKENPKEYSYTTAICNDSNLCQDHIITCQGSRVISTTPITGAVVQKPSTWTDPRTYEQINAFCNLS